MNKFRFLEWPVYGESKLVFADVLKIVKNLPQEYKFDLGNQATRAALSIILNIAEGSGNDSDKDMNRFFSISMGSIYETVAAIDVLRDNALITQKQFDDIHQKLESIANQLGGFKKKLKES